MVLVDFNATGYDYEPITVLEDPYFKVDIYAKDQSQIYYSRAQEWVQSTPLYTWNYMGETWTGLNGYYNLTAGTLTKNITIAETGTYQIFVKVLNNNWVDNGTVTLKIDGVQVDQTVQLKTLYCSPRMADLGYHYLSSGTKTFTLELNGRNSWVTELFLYKVDLYSTDENRSKYRLDVARAEWSQNTVSELNSLQLEMAFKESYYVPQKNDYSKMVFDLTDSVTLYVGEDRKNTRPAFGGYVLGWELDDDNTVMTLNHTDRFLDFYREPMYQNYIIGTSASSDEVKTFPVIQFASALEAVRHMCLTQEYPINPDGLTYPYGFIKNFGLESDFESVQTTVFEKVWDKRAGNPPPCLRVGYAPVAVSGCESYPVSSAAEMVIWSDEGNPWDAKIHNILAFDYLASGGGTTNPMEFNVLVRMYKAGQTPSQAVDYVIGFTGKAITASYKRLGNVRPVLNGTIQTFKFDLKAAFDLYANSTAYNVTKVSFIDTVSESQIINRLDSSMWIDNPHSYQAVMNMKLSIDQEAAYPFLVLQELADKMGYAAWIRYGATRRDDVLYMAPINQGPAEEAITQGVNVLQVSNKVYNPKEELYNKALRHFSYQSGDDTVTGSASHKNMDSYIRYGTFGHYESLSDVSLKADADIDSWRFVTQNAYSKPTATLSIKGTTLINPSNYVVTNIPGHYMDGNQEIKSIIQNVDLERGYFTTQIDLNQPSSRFKNILSDIKKQIYRVTNQNSRTMYDYQAMRNLGFISPGGFIKYLG